MVDTTGFRRLTGDTEEITDILRTAKGPSAVKIQVGFKMASFRQKILEGGVRIGGVIGALNRTSDHQNVGDDGVSEKDQVQITRGHFVDLINYEELGMFEKGSFPGTDAPGFDVGVAKNTLPVRAKIDIGDGDSERVFGGVIPEEFLNWVRLATAGETSNVSKADSTGGSKISIVVQILKVASLFFGTNNAIKAILEVGGQGFGAFQINRVTVEFTERQKKAALVAVGQEKIFKVISRFAALEHGGDAKRSGAPVTRFVIYGDGEAGRITKGERGETTRMNSDTPAEEGRKCSEVIGGKALGAFSF